MHTGEYYSILKQYYKTSVLNSPHNFLLGRRKQGQSWEGDNNGPTTMEMISNYTKRWDRGQSWGGIVIWAYHKENLITHGEPWGEKIPTGCNFFLRLKQPKNFVWSSCPGHQPIAGRLKAVKSKEIKYGIQNIP